MYNLVSPYIGKRDPFVLSDVFRFAACETVSYFWDLSKTLGLLMVCPSQCIQIRAIGGSQPKLVFPLV